MANIVAEEKEKLRRTPLTGVAELMLVYFPDLKNKLAMAQSERSAVQFLESAIAGALFTAFALLFLTAIFLYQNDISLIYLPIPTIIYPIAAFFYLMFYPDVAIMRRQREIDYEVLFAGRHLLIALRSGMPLFDSMTGLTRGYGAVSQEFNKIVEKVTLGTPLTQAIREVVQNNPSKYFVRVAMQVANSLSSGSDVGGSLDAVLDQIAKEQLIKLKEYGQKLTPAVMFFMIFGIIIPSIGVVLATVLFSVIGGDIGFQQYHLVVIFFAITIIQMLFLGVIETARPKYLI